MTQPINKQLACYTHLGNLPEAADRASWGLPDPDWQDNAREALRHLDPPVWAAAVPLSKPRELHRKLIVPAVMLALAFMLGLMFVAGFLFVLALLITLVFGVVLGVAIMFGYGFGYGFGFMRGYDVGTN